MLVWIKVFLLYINLFLDKGGGEELFCWIRNLVLILGYRFFKKNFYIINYYWYTYLIDLKVVFVDIVNVISFILYNDLYKRRRLIVFNEVDWYIVIGFGIRVLNIFD